MKTAFLFLLFFSTNAFSWNFELPRSVAFMEKSRRCKIAIGLNNTVGFISRDYVMESFDLNPKNISSLAPKPHTGVPFVNDVICLQDLVEAEGTINEKEGCTLAHYNLETNIFGRVLSMSNKLCQKGGYEELIPAIKNLLSGIDYNQIESNPRLKIFGIKTWSLIRTENPSISNLFNPHMNTNQSPTATQISAWKEFLKNEIESKASKEKNQAEEKAAAEKDNEKNRKKADKKQKDTEKLYE